MVNGRGVQSIDVGGRILAAMVQAGRPLMLRDVSAMADMAPAQAHAYLISFRRMELVEQDPATGLYLLGPFALHLGIGRMRSFSPLKLAGRAVAGFAAETGLRTMIAVWGTHGAVAVQIEEGEDDLHIDLRPGKHHPLVKTATGQVFTAFMPRPIIEPALKAELAEWDRKQFVGTPPSVSDALRRAEDVRLRGYGNVKDDPTPGIAAVSAPVFDQSGQIQFAVTLIGPSRKLDVSTESPQVRQLLVFVRRLSEELGYRNEASAGEAHDTTAKPVVVKRRNGSKDRQPGTTQSL